MQHARTQKRNAIVEQKVEMEKQLKKIRAQELRQKQRYEKGEPQSKRMVCLVTAFSHSPSAERLLRDSIGRMLHWMMTTKKQDLNLTSITAIPTIIQGQRQLPVHSNKKVSPLQVSIL